MHFDKGQSRLTRRRDGAQLPHTAPRAACADLRVACEPTPVPACATSQICIIRTAALDDGDHLGERLDVYLHRGTHRGADVERAPELALGARGLVLVDGLLHGLQVGEQVRLREVELAERHVHDALLVAAELELAALELGNSGGHVRGDGTRLWRGHQPLGPEHAAELSDLRHRRRGRDEHVKVKVTLADGLDQVVHADKVRTRRPGSLRHRPVREHRHAHRLACALGQGDRRADLLVVVLRVNVQPDVRLRRLDEFGARHLHHHRERLLRRVELLAIHRLLRERHALGEL
mmetsp:Transcript_5715/g.14923  ORF Transcript_5715/g.14923 Transcript_5715/m.14923 type:complete len:291 (-) Transcript_5715:158-1030(-)